MAHNLVQCYVVRPDKISFCRVFLSVIIFESNTIASIVCVTFQHCGQLDGEEKSLVRVAT